ncbi:MAG TPA: glycogen debranching protein GlgX [Devosiaceae bacterium]
MKPRLVPNAGRADPLGATVAADGVNFAVYSENASTILVCLFDERDRETDRIVLDGRDGHVHHGLVAGIGAGARYGLRADGRYAPDQGLFFDPEKLLVDPYARRLDRAFAYDARLALPRDRAVDTAALVPKAVIVAGRENLAPPSRVPRPGLIYEVPVRAFTKRHPGVATGQRGTVSALSAPRIIEHFRKIGADTVELMPVAAWVDEWHLGNLGLTNAWGYNPIAYSAPDPRLMPGGMRELREVTDQLRQAGINVVLDVVYNHTGEGDLSGPTLSLKGLDAPTYYQFASEHGALRLVNDTGTGNTLNCQHPATQRLIIDSLRLWVREGGVSGFRFDLATILGRDGNGFDAEAPLLQAIRKDSVLSRCLLIAEPWDVGPGGYQLGAFGRQFLEWNDRYRDEIRRFWRGDGDMLGRLADRLSGSSQEFRHGGRRPTASVNFVAAHDGFTLADVVAYANKHNAANGEGNRDGHNQNYSWNNGVEGETDDKAIISARRRDVRALLATLFFSRGTPMLTAGDEMGRTQGGNNNAYAQDNEVTWLDWDKADVELIDFVAQLAEFRRSHPALSDDHFLNGHKHHGVRDVIWLSAAGTEMQIGDWHDARGCVLGVQLNIENNQVLLWFNRDRVELKAKCPPPHGDGRWSVGLVSSQEHVKLEKSGQVTLPPRTVVALVA